MDDITIPLSRADLDKINERIWKLTAKLKDVSGDDRRLTPEEVVWNKELRILRRQRDNGV